MVEEKDGDMTEKDDPDLFENGFIRGSFRAIKEALLLRTEVYTAVTEAPIPSRRGFGILLVLLVTVSLTQIIGALFDVATLPEVNAIQQSLYEAITGLTIYANASAANPNFSSLFSTIYDLFWMFLRWFGGYPSKFGTLFTAVSFITSNLFAWLTYGFIGFYVAKAFGAKVEKMGDYLGLMGLAFAPFILYSVAIFPGLVVPVTLVSMWFLATAYQAIKSTYGLSWWRTALVVLLPFPINTILLTFTIIFGVVIGVAVSKMIAS
jgi:hypothetical protein